ncbi:MAG: metal-dependent transcriptional regulator [Candidatus Aerophobetes bacterium]|nr:metal-dependent transcriptional regulator [Candidatus Aerophobetes bacterium]
MEKTLTPTMEDYLEVISNLKKIKQVVRVKNIAQELKIKMPSVSETLKFLSKERLVRHERYGKIELTKKGNELAEEVKSRHRTLFKFLNEVLEIDPETANEDACKMEHSISAITLKRLMEFLESVKSSS